MAVDYDDYYDTGRDSVEEEVEAYLAQYGKAYSRGNLLKLSELSMMFYYLPPHRALFEEVFSHLNLRREREDIYQQDLALVEQYFPLNSNILEVGGGYYPAFAERLAKRQEQLQGGTITVYDPGLVTSSLPGIVLRKEKFTKKTDVSQEIDLYCGFAPCEATLLLIDRAVLEHKPLILRACSCGHFPTEESEEKYAGEDGWWKYVEDYMRNSLHSDEELIVDHNPILRDPVFVKRRKK